MPTDSYQLGHIVFNPIQCNMFVAGIIMHYDKPPPKIKFS